MAIPASDQQQADGIDQDHDVDGRNNINTSTEAKFVPQPMFAAPSTRQQPLSPGQCIQLINETFSIFNASCLDE